MTTDAIVPTWAEQREPVLGPDGTYSTMSVPRPQFKGIKMILLHTGAYRLFDDWGWLKDTTDQDEIRAMVAEWSLNSIGDTTYANTLRAKYNCVPVWVPPRPTTTRIPLSHITLDDLLGD